MLHILFGSLLGIDGSIFGVEVRMAVNYTKLIRSHNPDLVNVSDVGDLHILFIPL